MRLLPALAALAAITAAAPAAAAFFEGFEGETAGSSILDYASFANWTVTNGTVDLIRSGEYGIICRTGSYCVDLDGSSFAAGTLTLTTPIAFAAGDFIDIVFWVSGNQRGWSDDRFAWYALFAGPTNLIDFQWLVAGSYGSPVSIDNVISGDQLSDPIPFSAPFASYGFRFTAGNAGALTLSIDDTGGDQVGPVLDDVEINLRSAGGVVPEPATWAMLVAGFGLVGAVARRRRPAAA